MLSPLMSIYGLHSPKPVKPLFVLMTTTTFSALSSFPNEVIKGSFKGIRNLYNSVCTIEICSLMCLFLVLVVVKQDADTDIKTGKEWGIIVFQQIAAGVICCRDQHPCL